MKNLAPAILVCLLMLASCSSDGGCEGNCENGYGSYSWADSYEGEWKNGQRNPDIVSNLWKPEPSDISFGQVEMESVSENTVRKESKASQYGFARKINSE